MVIKRVCEVGRALHKKSNFAEPRATCTVFLRPPVKSYRRHTQLITHMMALLFNLPADHRALSLSCTRRTKVSCNELSFPTQSFCLLVCQSRDFANQRNAATGERAGASASTGQLDTSTFRSLERDRAARMEGAQRTRDRGSYSRTGG